MFKLAILTLVQDVNAIKNNVSFIHVICSSGSAMIFRDVRSSTVLAIFNILTILIKHEVQLGLK